MNYGPYTHDVREAIDFLKSGRLLCNPRIIYEPDLTVIRDLDDVESYRDLPPYADEDCDAWDWTAIQRAAGTEDHTILAEVSDRLGDELIDRFYDLWQNELYEVIKRQLAGRSCESETMEVVGNFEFIIDFRAAFGKTNVFMERMFRIYQSGGHPCGWDGIYPDGKMVVYYPPTDEGGAASA